MCHLFCQLFCTFLSWKIWANSWFGKRRHLIELSLWILLNEKRTRNQPSVSKAVFKLADPFPCIRFDWLVFPGKKFSLIESNCHVMMFLFIVIFGFYICCVFRPANGCSTSCLLVKIDFLKLKKFFLSLKEQNKQKIIGKPLKIMQNVQ